MTRAKPTETIFSLFAIFSAAAAVGKYYELALGKVYAIGFLGQRYWRAGDGEGDGEIRLQFVTLLISMCWHCDQRFGANITGLGRYRGAANPISSMPQAMDGRQRLVCRTFIPYLVRNHEMAVNSTLSVTFRWIYNISPSAVYPRHITSNGLQCLVS